MAVVMISTYALSSTVSFTALMYVDPAVAPAVTRPLASTVAEAVLEDHVIVGAGARSSESLASYTESMNRIVPRVRMRDVSRVIGCSLIRAGACRTCRTYAAHRPATAGQGAVALL